jgi:nucleoside-diphosphate-sugar epimerase
MAKVLVTGSTGQLGSDLVASLRSQFDPQQIIGSGRKPVHHIPADALPYEELNVQNWQRLHTIVEENHIDTLYHLASLLSANGEVNPYICWDINVNGLRHVLEAAKMYQLKIFWPSSIAVFGAHTPKVDTPQTTVTDPSTMYGITKVTGEMLCHYYALRFGVDIRSLRLPGLISYHTPPGGGTTDFAIEIFHAALKEGTYTCFLRPDTRLPMMYMPDAIKAIQELMAADLPPLRPSYNVSALSFSVGELVAEIQKHLPNFTCSYKPDFRQAIADSWPSVTDDSQARADWGWQPTYDLSATVADMLTKLSVRGGYPTPSTPPKLETILV